MKKNTKLHNSFLKLCESNLFKYIIIILIIVVLSCISFIISDFLLPIYSINLINDIFFKKEYFEVFEKIIFVILIILISKIFVNTVEYFNKKYFNNLNKNFKREIIKFLINNKIVFSGDERKIDYITDNTISIFYRSIIQLIPSVIVYFFILFYFLKTSYFYILSIGSYTIFSIIFIKKKINKEIFRIKEKKYLTSNNKLDLYIEDNKFNGNEKEFETSINNFSKEENSNFENTDNTNNAYLQDKSFEHEGHKKIKLQLKFLLKNNKKEFYFIIKNIIIFGLLNINSTSSLKIILFIFFTMQTIVLIKIIVNIYYLNVKNINSIKKYLNNLSIKTLI